MAIAKDTFPNGTPGLGSPVDNLFAVTPSDTADDEFAVVSRALYVGTAGNIKVKTVAGQTVTLTGVSGWLPIRVRQVFATDTTASAIVAGY